MFAHNDPRLLISTLGYPISSVAMGVLGRTQVSVREDVRQTFLEAYHNPEPVPEHFGYPRAPRLGMWFEEDRYVILSESFKVASLDPTLRAKGIYYPRIYRRGFDRNDFSRLEYDPSVNRLYSNGELDVWYVVAAGSSFHSRLR